MPPAGPSWSSEVKQRLCFFILISSVKSQTCRKHPPSPREVDAGHCPLGEGGLCVCVWGGFQGVAVGGKALLPAALRSWACHQDTWDLASFAGKEGPGCEGHKAFPALLPKPLELRNVGVEGRLGRQISHKLLFSHRCPEAPDGGPTLFHHLRFQ